jgi:hypothetical protein
VLLVLLAAAARRSRVGLDAPGAGFAVAGAPFGLACLVRADLLFAALVLAPAVGVAHGRRVGRRGGLAAGFAALAGVLVVVGPWSLYATRRDRAFLPITDGATTTLFVGTCLPGDGSIFGLKHALAPEALRVHPSLRGQAVFRLPEKVVLGAVTLVIRDSRATPPSRPSRIAAFASTCWGIAPRLPPHAGAAGRRGGRLGAGHARLASARRVAAWCQANLNGRRLFAMRASPDNGQEGGLVEASQTARVLVVAHKTAATEALLDVIHRRAARGPAQFHLLVPNPHPPSWRPAEASHPDVTEGEQVLALALPLIERAAGGPAEGSVSPRHDPMDAIEETLHDGDFDEIILSTLPRPVSRWLHLDLPHRVAHLGLPLTTVVAQEGATSGAA